jgi:Domain of unknown function (DUF4062)
MIISEHRIRAFLGSTLLDLPDHRTAVVEACQRVGVEPLNLPTDDSDPLAISGPLLEEADIYIGVLAFRYGYVPRGQEKSLIEIEFERAGVRGIPRLLFLMSSNHPVLFKDVELGPAAEKLEKFKSLVRRELLVTEFSSPDELKAAVVTGLVGVLDRQASRVKPASVLLLLEASHGQLDDFLSRELHRYGVIVLRLDEMARYSVLSIRELIQDADLVLADITNATPNIMYELGYAHALKKPTILLADSDAARIPSDLNGFAYYTYDKGDLDSLRKPIERVVREYIKEARR